jgi:hypothetical protein
MLLARCPEDRGTGGLSGQGIMCLTTKMKVRLVDEVVRDLAADTGVVLTTAAE